MKLDSHQHPNYLWQAVPRYGKNVDHSFFNCRHLLLEILALSCLSISEGYMIIQAVDKRYTLAVKMFLELRDISLNARLKCVAVKLLTIRYWYLGLPR